MKKPEALLLDLGNVVFQLDWSNTGLKKSLIDQIQTWGPYDQYERGKMTTDEFLLFINQVQNKKFEKQDFIVAWQSLITGYLDGMADLLADLSSQLPLYALTNTNPLHFDYILSEFSEMKLFRKIFSSVHTGFRKPEREIFEAVVEEMGVLPSKILYIDDCVGHIEAARDFGLVAELFSGKNATHLKQLLWKHHITS